MQYRTVKGRRRASRCQSYSFVARWRLDRPGHAASGQGSRACLEETPDGRTIAPTPLVMPNCFVANSLSELGLFCPSQTARPAAVRQNTPVFHVIDLVPL